VPRDQAILLQAHPGGCYGQQPHERQQAAQRLDEADAEKTLLLVLLGVAKNQKYITQKKLLELQGKLEEIGRIIGGLQKFFINNRK
jgi:hypothetical protein